jgi:uncharacterized protein (TIGR02246 family)
MAHLMVLLTIVGHLALIIAQPADAQLAALNQMMATVNAGDAAGYARLYAPDAVITIYGTGELKGRAAIEAHEVELLRQFPGARLAFSDVWQDGRRAVVRYMINARTATGQAMGHEGLLFFRFDTAGAITEEHRYQDSLTPMAQLGALRATAFRAPPPLPATFTTHVAGRSPQEQSNAAVVADLFAAINAGRQSEARSLFAADAAIDEVFLPQPFTGTDAPGAWLQAWADAGTKLDVATLLPIGADVLVESAARGTLARNLGLVPASTRPFSIRRGFIIRLRNGEITSVAAFVNGKEIAESTGSWPIK